MYDVASVNKRYFDITLHVTGEDGAVQDVKLAVEPPKVKQLRKLMDAAKPENTEAMDELRDVVRDMLSKNKSGYQVPDEYVDELDLDQLLGILVAYFEWVQGVRKAKN